MAPRARAMPPPLGCADPGEALRDGEPPTLPADKIPLQGRRRYPSDPSCKGRGDGKLHGGGAARDITPQVEAFEDTRSIGPLADPQIVGTLRQLAQAAEKMSKNASASRAERQDGGPP